MVVHGVAHGDQLTRGSEKRSSADGHRRDVEDDAVEVEKAALPEPRVYPELEVQRCPHPSVQGRVSFGLVDELLTARSKGPLRGQESGIVGARAEGVYTTAGEGNFATSRKGRAAMSS